MTKAFPNVYRARVPVHSDAWARGDRYGTVEFWKRNKDGRELWHVRLDKSNKLVWFRGEECELV